MAFVDAVVANLVAPVLIFDAGVDLALVAEGLADVETSLRLAEHLMHRPGATRADEVDEAGELAIDATQAEGKQPGRGDLISGARYIGTTATVAAVIPIAEYINGEIPA